MHGIYSPLTINYSVLLNVHHYYYYFYCSYISHWLLSFPPPPKIYIYDDNSAKSGFYTPTCRFRMLPWLTRVSTSPESIIAKVANRQPWKTRFCSFLLLYFFSQASVLTTVAITMKQASLCRDSAISLYI